MSRIRIVTLAVLAGLAGCSVAREAPVAEAPAARPAAEAPPPEAAGRARESDPLVEFYANVEGGLTTSGRMRRDTAPDDAPYGVAELVRNFERIALYDEYVEVSGRFLHRETPALLRRWEGPVRVGAIIGPSVPPEQAARDRANVAAYTRRLAGLTGLDMAFSDGPDVNFLVMFLDQEEQAAFADEAAARYPGFSASVADAFRATPVDTFCTAYAFAEPARPPVYAAVMILIKSEHPDLTRLSCVQEEMAQAMGLPNDSPDARPSLFNDSLEFALLTEHDEILLRMLYDPRLKPGMSAEEARPLLPAVARDAIAAQRAAGRVAALPES
jgi:hypothetical protein